MLNRKQCFHETNNFGTEFQIHSYSNNFNRAFCFLTKVELQAMHDFSWFYQKLHSGVGPSLSLTHCCFLSTRKFLNSFCRAIPEHALNCPRWGRALRDVLERSPGQISLSQEKYLEITLIYFIDVILLSIEVQNISRKFL